MNERRAKAPVVPRRSNIEFHGIHIDHEPGK